MKIAHIADIHWGLGYPGPTPAARFDDITRIMDWAADRMIAEQVDLVLVAGDMFRKADISLDKASREIRAAAAWLRKISAAGVEVVVISGTPSHDPISAYELLKEFNIPRVTIVTEPDFLDIDAPDLCLSIACVPGMDRSNFATRDEYRGLPAHVVHQQMTEEISHLCQQFLQDCSYSPTILLGHYSYDLADKGFEDVLMQQEAILTQEAVQGYDLVALGHIHRPQQNDIVFYSGSPERLSFNDEGIDAGLWIHEWDQDTGRQLPARFIHTPARQYVTIKWYESQVRDYLHNGLDADQAQAEQITDSIIRLHYTCSEDLNKQLNRRQLEAALYKAGAFFVAEIRGDIERTDRQRDAEVTESLGPIQALQKWAVGQEIDPAEIDELTAMTAQLMEVAA